MTAEKIKRINELYHKSKKEGLAPEEKEEQAALRKEYLASIRQSLNTTLKNVSILEPDGTVTEIKKIVEAKEKRSH